MAMTFDYKKIDEIMSKSGRYFSSTKPHFDEFFENCPKEYVAMMAEFFKVALGVDPLLEMSVLPENFFAGRKCLDKNGYLSIPENIKTIMPGALRGSNAEHVYIKNRPDALAGLVNGGVIDCSVLENDSIDGSGISVIYFGGSSWCKNITTVDVSGLLTAPAEDTDTGKPLLEIAFAPGCGLIQDEVDRFDLKQNNHQGSNWEVLIGLV